MLNQSIPTEHRGKEKLVELQVLVGSGVKWFQCCLQAIRKSCTSFGGCCSHWRRIANFTDFSMAPMELLMRIWKEMFAYKVVYNEFKFNTVKFFGVFKAGGVEFLSLARPPWLRGENFGINWFNSGGIKWTKLKIFLHFYYFLFFYKKIMKKELFVKNISRV